MLGRDLVAVLNGREVLPLRRVDLDVTDAHAAAALVRPGDVVVNCAAWTDVDGAEEHEAEAFAVNALGVANLARACAAVGATLVQVSTDYVFAGDATVPYAEDAPLAPRSAYGRTKAAGEWAVGAHRPPRAYVVRTAWLYGRHGRSFPATMLRLSAERDVLDVVDDQRGQPTWSRDVAERIVRLVEAGAPSGVYHATSSGEATWFDLARRVLDLAGLDPQRVHPVDSSRFARPARRPAYSVLGHDGWAPAGLPPMPAWDEAVATAHAEGAFDR
jgi:dTDP-4-dehydrorhamnose reductase